MVTLAVIYTMSSHGGSVLMGCTSPSKGSDACFLTQETRMCSFMEMFLFVKMLKSPDSQLLVTRAAGTYHSEKGEEVKKVTHTTLQCQQNFPLPLV